MAAVTRLVTFVDVDGQATETVSVSARHEVELATGGWVPLLTDRGWGTSQRWADASEADIRETARVVVGPDEPFEGRSQEDMERSHWASLQQTARQHGLTVDATTLSHLPHDIVLSERVLARIRDTRPR